MLLVWAGYATGLWGYCLVRGYDLTLGDLMSPLHPYSGPWPPPQIPDGQFMPGGKAKAAAATTAPGAGSPGTVLA
jgi:hypothetical protein